jgi:hypothetical protein
LRGISTPVPTPRASPAAKRIEGPRVGIVWTYLGRGEREFNFSKKRDKRGGGSTTFVVRTISYIQNKSTRI